MRLAERAGVQPAAHDTPALLPFDEARALEDVQVLEEARERHPEGFRKLADRMPAARKKGQHSPPRGVGERAENGVEGRGLIVNHPVHYKRNAPPASSGTARTRGTAGYLAGGVSTRAMGASASSRAMAASASLLLTVTCTDGKR